MKVVKADAWHPPRNFYKCQRCPSGRKAHRQYLDHITAFDIETTRIEEIDNSIMYIWQFAIDAETVIIGRTWDEFDALLHKIIDGMRGKQTLVIWVHNLSYEFQFLRGIYNFTAEEVLAVKSRKILTCKMFDERIEMRCSYLQTNMSLGEFTKKMGAEHSKLSGVEFDYDKKRYPWTTLSDAELQYCYNDVVGLCEALKIEMHRDNDNLYTIPLTSTGYVRRDAKSAMTGLPHDDYKIDMDVYTALREAFRGGNTHANRFYAGIILSNVKSADRSSSYPDVQCNQRFPCGKWVKRPFLKACDIDRKIDHGKSLLLRLRFRNIRLTNEEWPCPYLTLDKGRNVTGYQLDNGRILHADTYDTTVTDIDYGIINEEYSYDSIEVLAAWENNYTRLPSRLVETIESYYSAKTELKGVPGQELYYMLAKQKLNGIYGMSAQDPVKPSIIFSESAVETAAGLMEHYTLENVSAEELLSVANKRVWMPYAWGVWTTAYARRALEDGIKLAGDDFVYCDTDSVKYQGVIDWTAFNNQRISDSTDNGALATDPSGVTHYMGVFEQEDTYDRFITLGAKKYAYEIKGKLGITVAGVNKEEGAKELGCLENFRVGFEFRAGGGLESVYNDEPYGTYIIDGHEVYITQNVCLRPSTYRIGLGDDYARLLHTVSSDLHFRERLLSFFKTIDNNTKP